ncbi:hypothetical protein [Vibrio cholerae]|uniref:hypothetical protein n=1 Tax=Vibrio cholerae TaxID=666 RepID=UPI0001BAD469|nr:hypothetical protein VIH_001049 [Vibrio cholerae CT 5369-93]EKF9989630.1 hypothetical protein [Vibrio cholerae]
MWFIETFIYPLVGGATGAILVAKFLAKQLIEQRFRKDMANYQATLTEKTESLKNSLSIFAHERNIQNSRVDAQTAKAIQTVYSALSVLLKNAREFANGKPYPVSASEEYEGVDSQDARDFRFYKEKAELTSNAARQLESILLDNAIFIESSVYEKIENLSNRFYELSESYVQIIIEEECSRDEVEEILDELKDMRTELKNYYNGELTKLVDDIVKVFRDKLGIEKI